MVTLIPGRTAPIEGRALALVALHEYKLQIKPSPPSIVFVADPETLMTN